MLAHVTTVQVGWDGGDFFRILAKLELEQKTRQGREWRSERGNVVPRLVEVFALAPICAQPEFGKALRTGTLAMQINYLVLQKTLSKD